MSTPEPLPGGLEPEAGNVTLRPSRRKLLALFAVSLFFALSGAVIGVTGGGAIGWIALAFFGIGVVVFGINMRPGASYLHLTSEGYEESSLFRAHETAWEQVGVFATYRNSFGVFSQSRVGFDYAEGEEPRGADVARTVAGVEGALADNYGLSAEQLAEVLNAWRGHYAGPPPGSP